MGSIGTRIAPGPVIRFALVVLGLVVVGLACLLQGFWLLVLGLPPAHERADDIGLVAGRDLLAHPLPRSRVPVGPVQPGGGHRSPPDRQLVEDGLVEIAVDRHRGGSRDRGRGHDEHVGMPRALLGLGSPGRAFTLANAVAGDGRRALLPQCRPLLDPESVLLVDHHDPERAETDVVGQQGMRAHDEVKAPVHELGLDPSPLAASSPVREQCDLERARACYAGAVVDLQPGQEAASGEVMLLGEHFCRDHEGALMAALHAVQKSRQCHDRLAGADVALQETVHRVRSGKISCNLADRPLLGGGQLERQAPEEFLDEARPARRRCDDVRDPGSLGRGGTFLHDKDELEPQQLVEGEAAAGGVSLLEALGGVYPPERLRPPDQAELVDELRWQDLGQGPAAFQRLGDI